MDIAIRDIGPSDAPSLAHILITANDHAFRGLVPDQCLEFTEAESEANWRKFLSQGLPADDFMLVAETPTHEGVGYAWARPNTKDNLYQAELRQLMVLPDYQGQGIGRLLVRISAQRLLAKELRSLRVEVLRVNPNRPFYEHLGATYQSDYDYDWDGVSLSMCVYGWPDIRLLLANELD
jgi:GNAT superfamily N-acetyltransferase